jgi:hypothetical protein
MKNFIKNSLLLFAIFGITMNSQGQNQTPIYLSKVQLKTATTQLQSLQGIQFIHKNLSDKGFKNNGDDDFLYLEFEKKESNGTKTTIIANLQGYENAQTKEFGIIGTFTKAGKTYTGIVKGKDNTPSSNFKESKLEVLKANKFELKQVGSGPSGTFEELEIEGVEYTLQGGAQAQQILVQLLACLITESVNDCSTGCANNLKDCIKKNKKSLGKALQKIWESGSNASNVVDSGFRLIKFGGQIFECASIPCMMCIGKQVGDCVPGF